MLRKMVIGTALAAAITACGAMTAFAQGVDKVDTQGIRFEIPEEFQDQLTIKEDGLGNGEIVAVYETASIEAAEEMGQDSDGIGFLFSISTVGEGQLKEMRCGDMSGIQVFAEDDDIYYLFNTATDVRLVRTSNEEMDASMENWEKLNNWANQEVRQEILANNPELDQEFYTNTNLDMFLAQAAYKPGTKYELRSLDYGPDPLDPASLREDDFIEDLANDFTYEVLPDAQAPDGEYYVMAFDVEGDEVRFDFFQAPGTEDLIREVRTIEGEEYETFYQANPKGMDDANKTTTGIVKAWCKAIAGGRDHDDYYDDDYDDYYENDYDDDFDDFYDD